MKLGKSQQYIPEITANIVNTPKTIFSFLYLNHFIFQHYIFQYNKHSQYTPIKKNSLYWLNIFYLLPKLLRINSIRNQLSKSLLHSLFIFLICNSKPTIPCLQHLHVRSFFFQKLVHYIR